jgi:DNA-binding NarL/FixJ family response regulator
VAEGTSQKASVMTIVPSSRLSPKELRIVQLLTDGMTNPDIANAIGTTEQTVKNNLRHIYDTTGMDNRVELALWYVAHTEQAVGS